MSSIAKNLFSFSKNQDQDVNAKFNKIQTLVKQLQKQKLQQIPIKLKTILNIALGQGNTHSLLQQVYVSCMKQSPIEWVPLIGRLLNTFGTNSPLMRTILEMQDYKMPLQKNYLPAYLFRNNLINQKSAYHNVSTSMSGLTVPILDYVIIRLLHAISESTFICQNKKKPNQEYQSDDFFFYISRNPFLLLLKNYINFIGNNSKNSMRISNLIKMFFVDELLLKHRINKSTSYLKELSFATSRYRLKPQNLLVIYLLLQRDRVYFEERNLFFTQLIERFYSLIQKEDEIFFRFLFRIFLFAYSKHSVENKVIDLLQKANPNDGYFELGRYSIDQFVSSIRTNQKKQIFDYNQTKPLLLKLLQKDQNLGTPAKVHFSTLRTLGAFLCLQLHMNSAVLSSSKKMQDPLRRNSEASSIQIAIEKIYRSIRSFLKRQNAKTTRDFSKQNQKKLYAQIDQIVELFSNSYHRKIDLRKFEDLKESTLDRTFNIRGTNEDFALSVESYKKEIEGNFWKVPLKDSEYQILYDIFYSLAKFLDKLIPGRKPRSEPRINLRYFSNPIVFMVTMILIVLLMKIIF